MRASKQLIPTLLRSIFTYWMKTQWPSTALCPWLQKTVIRWHCERFFQAPRSSFSVSSAWWREGSSTQCSINDIDNTVLFFNPKMDSIFLGITELYSKYQYCKDAFFFLDPMNPISFKKNTHWEDRKWFLSWSPIKERRMIIKSNKSDLTIKYFPWKHFMIIFSLIILNVTYLGF